MSHQLDDPRAIDAFFAAFNNTSTSKKEPRETQGKVNDGIGIQNNNRAAHAGGHAVSTSNEELAVNTPAKQIIAPAHDATVSSTTPASPAAVSTKNILNSSLANENQDQALTQGNKKPDLKATSSKPAWVGKEDRANYLYSPNKLDYNEMPQRMTSVQVELLEKLGRSSAGHSNYQKDVVAKFKAAAEVAERLGATQSLPVEENDQSLSREILEKSQEEVKEKEDAPSHENQPVDESSLSFHENTVNSETFQTYHDNEVPSSSALTISPATSPLAAPVDMAESPHSISEDVVVIKQEPDDSTAAGLQGSETNNLTRGAGIISSTIAEMTLDERKDKKSHEDVHPGNQPDVEDRKHAAVFKSWGPPAKRDKPASQVRKIILSHLPPKTDFTLIQSLIHGGAIEDMVLNSSGTTAQVLFTTADACEKYFAKYPNGLKFKLKGKTHTVFIDKGKDVDVISGMLEGYLGAGATRVVQASDADEDWSMRALSKIAEGKNGRRKVESIMDSFRDDVRTITFRFTGITDAVVFRGSLLRDPEWEYSNLQFVADPCETATDVHFD